MQTTMNSREHAHTKTGAMSRAAKSIFVFGIYLIGMGAGLLTMPNQVLGTFGLPAANEVWVRVVGVLVLFLAYYYIQAARHEATDFFRATIPTRASLIVFFAAFVVLGFAPAALLMLAPPDLLGAIWTAVELRNAKS